MTNSAFEEDIQALGTWLREQGKPSSTIYSYKSRARRFTRWYKREHGHPPVANYIQPALMEHYVAALHAAGLTETQARRELAGWLRTYLRWALDTGRLSHDPFRPRIAGTDDFCQWLESLGQQPSTTRLYRNHLLTFARWYNEAEGQELTPEAATAANLEMYLAHVRKTDRYVKSSMCMCRAAIIRYAQWGEETGHITDDPFQSVRWSEINAFTAWLDRCGKKKSTVSGYATGLRQFGKWYDRSRGKRLVRENVTPQDVTDFARYLKSEKKITIASSYQRVTAARAYVTWSNYSLFTINIQGFLDEFSAWLEERRGLCWNTIKAYRHRVRAFARWHLKTKGIFLKPAGATPENFQAYCEDTNLKQANRASHKTAVRVYVHWAVDTGRIERDPFSVGRPSVRLRNQRERAFDEWSRARGYSYETLRRCLTGLRSFTLWYEDTKAAGLEPENVIREDLNEYALFLKSERKSSNWTIQNHLQGVRSFLRSVGNEAALRPDIRVLHLSTKMRRKLKRLLKKKLTKQYEIRVRGLLSLDKGKSVLQVAEEAGVSPQAVYYWISRLPDTPHPRSKGRRSSPRPGGRTARSSHP